MRQRSYKKNICLAGLALLLVAGLLVETAMAYFTTYKVAEGGVKLNFGYAEMMLSETVNLEAQQKEITVKNAGDAACYVRIKAFAGEENKDDLYYVEPGDAGKWGPGTSEDGFYYYSEIVPANGSTTPIHVGFFLPEGEEAMEFNVIIIEESTPVLYDAQGEPYADWDAQADVIRSVTP